MRLLDLCCGAGGAAMGYYRAGFEVVGIDIKPMSRFPFEFHQADAFEYLEKHWNEFDVIHVSPPCQGYSKANIQWRLEGREYPKLINEFRGQILDTNKPYIIENVSGAKAELINPILLNGAMFGLFIHRPRYFECSFKINQPEMPSVPKPLKMGRPPQKEGDYIQPVGHFSGVDYARKQMQIDWMTGKELSQAIPPAYTEYVGKEYLRLM